ncbi:hypothetical protein BGLT_07033 [Caballeronia glathei]|uniref:DUF1508 domain-containing protein n=1 Tax=Caballeronia glathei TaxID=60547 RepID=A0A069PHV9_9BURK|nr:hypothetical protein [Caballeronia glathei]KDR39952.1 hypothetical protein BG61_28550 [Caballeronia glathei]CEJ96054.1 hypothetical protein BGLT_07033 [Caballeronia glathei]
MPTESFSYNGKKIEIEMTDDGQGNWQWAYKINGEHYTDSQDRPYRSYETTLKQAKLAAERHVEAIGGIALDEG